VQIGATLATQTDIQRKTRRYRHQPDFWFL